MLYQKKYRIDSIRLKQWDYRAPGYYFVTICVQQRWTQPFGYIHNGYMCLSDIGQMVANAWLQTSHIRINVQLDAWVVMPDHVHGIVQIVHPPSHHPPSHHNETVNDHQPIHHNQFGSQSNNLAAIVRGFKGMTTKQIHVAGYHHFQWQPRYYETIIRSHQALLNVRRYILNNPKKWYNQIQ